MNKKTVSPYDAGLIAGAGAEAKMQMSAFEMSVQSLDFTIGYIIGYSRSESIRSASHHIEASTAGELGFLYKLPFETLRQHYKDTFDEELHRVMRQAYEDAAEGDE